MAFFRDQQLHKDRLDVLLRGVVSNPQQRSSNDQLLSSVEEDFGGYLHKLIAYAGLEPSYRRKVLLRQVVVLCIVFGVSVASAIYYLLILALLSPCFEFAHLKSLAKKRSQAFEADYTALLLSLASSVKAGRDPLSALLDAEEVFEEGTQIRKEVALLRASIEAHESEAVAVSKFGQTIDHPDINLFRIAYILSRQEGSALSSCLERLAKVTRHRQSFRRKVRSAVALQRLSSYGIAAVAFITLGFQAFSNTEALHKAMNHPVGIVGLSAGVVLMLTGLFWMSKVAPSRY
ncbi:MAG: type II secretion system F family protein [Bdellovibrionales bacterium]|nr:type II secretion system F family protein [Bdellovibrionales bacterium]